MEMRKRALSFTCPTTGATNSNINVMTTIREEIAELKRELHTRQRVYPEWKVLGKITQKDAEHRIACLESSIKRLEEIERQQVGSQATMFDYG